VGLTSFLPVAQRTATENPLAAEISVLETAAMR
jgi:hypothetical protein